MKTALLCCIHGNLHALEAVGKDIEAQHVDRVFCLGDVIGYGAQPHECIAYVRARKWPTLLGNHEAAALNPALTSGFTPIARDCIFYTLGALSKDDRAWLKTLPQTHEEPDFQLAHGSPLPVTYERYIVAVDGAEDAFAAATRKWVFVGHTHKPIAFFKTAPISYSHDPFIKLDHNIPAIVNVGSVGQPRDKDPRACYALFDSDTNQVEYRRVAYDKDNAAAEIRAAGLPVKMADRLLEGA